MMRPQVSFGLCPQGAKSSAGVKLSLCRDEAWADFMCSHDVPCVSQEVLTRHGIVLSVHEER